MNTVLKFGIAGLDWDEVCRLIERAPLGTRDPEAMLRACEGSHTVCTAWHGETLVGFGRAISDGQYQSVIYDVVVLPEVQGRGVGRAVMEAILDRLPDPANVLIYVVPGKQGFYRQLGFGDLTTGMARFPNPEAARTAGYLK